MKRERLGDLSALSCALACGLGNTATKSALSSLSSEMFNFYMFTFAFIFSSFSLLNKGTRRDILNINWSVFRLISVISILSALALWLNATAMKSIAPATVSFLSRFEVVLTVIFAYFFLKERLNLYEIIGGFIALIGVLVLKFKTNIIISHGATLTVIAALLFACTEIINKKNIARLDTAALLFYRNLLIIPIMYILTVIKGERLSLPPLSVLAVTAGAGFLLPVLGRATYQWAMQRINLSRASLFTQATPIFTALFAFLILQSVLTSIEWIGGALIAGGVVVIKLSESRRQLVALLKPIRIYWDENT